MCGVYLVPLNKPLKWYNMSSGYKKDKTQFIKSRGIKNVVYSRCLQVYGSTSNPCKFMVLSVLWVDI